MNDNIIPYVPIADRVQATTVEAALLCQKFFLLIDEIIDAQIDFNHDLSKGSLCINPAHINDIMAELGDSDEVDVEILLPHLSKLIYPKFLGIKTIISPIWNSQPVVVWHFQLDQMEQLDTDKKSVIDIEKLSEITLDDANDYVDEAVAMLRLWRSSLETHTDNPQLEYRVNDVTTMLLEIELKLNKAKNMMTVR